MISLNNITLTRGTKELIINSSVAIFAKQKVGLVGKNGCGKTSLFALIQNQLHLDTGEVKLPSSLRISHLLQEIPSGKVSAIEYAMQGDEENYRLLTKLQLAEEKEDHELAAKLHQNLYDTDGYALKAKAGRVLNGLGFKTNEQEQPINSFSGGWRMRLNLAKTLMKPSDLLLLDEPTNHLDLDAIIWLEKFLKNYPGILVLISHDREFLDQITTKIIHIENQQLNLYSGNYSAFEKQRVEKLEQQQALFESQKKQINKTQKFIDKFRYKATKAKQVQSRVKALERLEIIAEAQSFSPFRFEFKEPKKISSSLVKLNNSELGYGNKVILSGVNFTINPGDRIGFLGINGAGKSTLVKSLAQTLAPLTGDVLTTKHLSIGYFAQHLLDHLDLSATPLQYLQRIDKKITAQNARSFLGGFAFHGDMVTQAITHFSGGEKARLVLAIIVWQSPNLLLLDEPTNHLDLEMREALVIALQNFSGALVLVSHDRHLLKTTVDELYLIDQGKVELFKGDVDDYAKWALEDHSTQSKTEGSSNKTAQEEREQTKKKNSLKNKAKKFEAELEKLYQDKHEINHLLADDGLYTENQSDKLKKILGEQKLLDEKIAETENSWMVILDELEN